MNPIRLGYSSWIIILIIILIITLVIQLTGQNTDTFINYPQQVDPMKTVNSNPDVAAANNNYAALLLFLQNNPSKSGNFIADIKQKFFTNNCTVKSDIDFNNIAKMSSGMPFS
jgi:hypothetical protein